MALPPKHVDPLGGFKLTAVPRLRDNSAAVPKGTSPLKRTPSAFSRQSSCSQRSASANSTRSTTSKTLDPEEVKKKMSKPPSIAPGRLANAGGLTPRYAKEYFEKEMQKAKEKKKKTEDEKKVEAGVVPCDLPVPEKKAPQMGAARQPKLSLLRPATRSRSTSTKPDSSELPSSRSASTASKPATTTHSGTRAGSAKTTLGRAVIGAVASSSRTPSTTGPTVKPVLGALGGKGRVPLRVTRPGGVSQPTAPPVAASAVDAAEETKPKSKTPRNSAGSTGTPRTSAGRSATTTPRNSTNSTSSVKQPKTTMSVVKPKPSLAAGTRTRAQSADKKKTLQSVNADAHKENGAAKQLTAGRPGRAVVARKPIETASRPASATTRKPLSGLAMKSRPNTATNAAVSRPQAIAAQ